MSKARSGFRTARVLALAALLGVSAPVRAADDRTVNEKILDILLEQGTIDTERYEELSREAQEEKRLLASARAEADHEEETDPKGWRAFWRDGVRIERNDGLVKMAFGGRLQVDFGGASAQSALQRTTTGGNSENPPEPFDAEGHGVEIRRARIGASGSFGENGIFKSEFDFAGGEVTLDDVYAGLRGIPLLGTIRLGHMKEPASLDEQTSTKFTTFMERALPVAAFSPGRNTGVGVGSTLFDQRMTWSAGAFREVGSSGDGFSNHSAYNATVRVTSLPVWEEDGRRMLHTGFWYSHKFRHDGPLQYQPIAESHLVGPLTSMPEISTDGVDLAGAELAFAVGPFSMQGEYIHSFVQGGQDQRDVDFYGSYVFASYVLTGERRPYDQQRAAFGRLRPSHPFSIGEGSFGAWELAGRWSLLDLNDQDVRGGILNNFTAAVNWYLYDNMRLQTNYVLAHRNNVGNDHIVQSRVAVDF